MACFSTKGVSSYVWQISVWYHIIQPDFFLRLYLIKWIQKYGKRPIFILLMNIEWLLRFTFLTTSFSRRLSHNVFLTTFFSQPLSHNVILLTSFLQRISQTSFSQRLSHNVFSHRFPYIFVVLKTSNLS